MLNFIELPIIVFIVVILFNIFKFKKKKGLKKYKHSDEEYFNREVMRYNSTVYAHEFNKRLAELSRKGFNVPGVYIFTNLNNNKKYVGQSIHLLTRVKGHLKGTGSPALYSDLKCGHKFSVRFIKLKDTRFKNLNSLEKYYISKLNSYYSGYNKTRGNK